MAQELTSWSTSKITLHSATKHTKAETHWARAKHVIAFHLHTNRYVKMGKENQLRFNPHTIRGLNEWRMFFIHRASIVVTGTCLHKISISILKNVELCKNLKVLKVWQKDIRVLCLGDIRKKNSFRYEWNTRHGTSWIFYVNKLFNNTAANICLFFSCLFWYFWNWTTKAELSTLLHVMPSQRSAFGAITTPRTWPVDCTRW